MAGLPSTERARAWLRRLAAPVVVLPALVGVLAVALVAFALHRPEPPSYVPTPPAPAEAGARLVGPVVYTIDASGSEDWLFFDFSRGSVVERPGPREWDLAVRRFHVIANGGVRFAGEGGLLDLGELSFESVRRAPADGYQPTLVRGDSSNAGIGKWYDYGFTTHLLEPKPRVYAVRTADGRYAKFQILGYYCPGARPGCLTFRYLYQGDGSRRLAPE